MVTGSPPDSVELAASIAGLPVALNELRHVSARRYLKRLSSGSMIGLPAPPTWSPLTPAEKPMAVPTLPTRLLPSDTKLPVTSGNGLFPAMMLFMVTGLEFPPLIPPPLSVIVLLSIVAMTS